MYRNTLYDTHISTYDVSQRELQEREKEWSRINKLVSVN